MCTCMQEIVWVSGEYKQKHYRDGQLGIQLWLPLKKNQLPNNCSVNVIQSSILK